MPKSPIQCYSLYSFSIKLSPIFIYNNNFVDDEEFYEEDMEIGVDDDDEDDDDEEGEIEDEFDEGTGNPLSICVSL